MLTFQQLYSEAQAQTQDESATSLVVIKRGINQGAKRFGSVLNRDWRKSEKTFNIVASQRYYQMPEDCLRIKSLTVLVGSTTYPLIEIPDEETWHALTMRSQTSSVPQHYYIRGNDEFGIWPTPSAAITSGGQLNYERRMRVMSADDYTTGTVTMTNGSAAVTGSSTVWTSLTSGRTLLVEDGGTENEIGYKIASFTSTTSVSLEQTYGGNSGSGKSYRIGEVPDIPEEYHESLIDYACFRYYRRYRDMTAAKDMLATFKESLKECQEIYGSKTTSNYYRPIRLSGYVHQNRDLTVSS